MMRRFLVLGFLLLTLSLGLMAEVRQEVLIYPSTDQHGDSIMLSGMVTIPTDKPAKGILLIPHYTILSNNEAPSNQLLYDAKFYKEDYVLLMPDYIGYGITADRPHPYLAGELTAINGIDMVLAAQTMLDTMQLDIPLDSIYIAGYSQGGFSALWTLRVIEESYADRIHVKACFAGAGPYDVAVTYDETLATKRVPMAALIPLMVIGTDVAYDLHIDRSEIFTPATEKLYQRYIENKQFSVMQVYFKSLNHNLKRWLKPAGMDKTHPQTMRLYEGFQRSSIVGDSICPSWTPKAPLYVFHSTQDETVTIRCAEHLQRCYPDLPNVTYDFGPYGKHIQASRIFHTRVSEMLLKE